MGGVVRAHTMIEHGYSIGQLRASVRKGVLIRPRRGWLALRDADPARLGAVSAGVVLTCITQAKRLGLWVLDHPMPHCASPSPTSTVRATNFVLHRSAPPSLRPPGTIEDPIENVLWIVASCQPFESALAIWDSALNQRLVTYQALDQLPLTRRARRVLEASSPYADSGLESMVRSRLRWLKVKIRPQAVVLDRRVDFLIGDRLIVQIDGGHHVGQQRSDDIRHDARLLANGFRVIRLSYAQVVHDWPETQSIIMQALARGLHLVR